MCDGCGSGDCGFSGGAGGPSYNNGYNTVGMGDVVIPGPTSYGSGDSFAQGRKNKRSKISGLSKKKTPADSFSGFTSVPSGGFGRGDLPLIVPSGPKK